MAFRAGLIGSIVVGGILAIGVVCVALTWKPSIEPVTPPGLVYASESFAALAAAEAATSFRCEYVGQTAQAKGYGTFPTYVVRRSTGHLATSA